MKSTLQALLLLIVPLLALQVNAQTTITVDASGEVLVPADIVNLQINIRVTGQTPGNVFDEHKRQEQFLAGLIRDRGLDDDRLTFQPLNISARQTREGREFASNQRVGLTLDDFHLFEEMQLLLIENGFENFSGRFGSTERESGENKALELAIANAKHKAARIAENIGKILGEVVSVEHTAARIVRAHGVESADLRAELDSMMEFNQTIPVSSSVRMIFSTEN